MELASEFIFAQDPQHLLDEARLFKELGKSILLIDCPGQDDGEVHGHFQPVGVLLWFNVVDDELAHRGA